MKNLLWLLLFVSTFSYSNDPIVCAPEIKNIRGVYAIVSSVKDGNWYDGSTWSNGKVPAEADDITFSHNITSSRQITIKGRLIATRGKITFTGINETLMVGSNLDKARESDVGLFVLDGGQLLLTGEAKVSWANSLGSILKGATSIQVASNIGWRIGDEIVICPTRKPTANPDWSDATNSLIDPMVAEFESRIITGINGNIVTFKEPLKYDHLNVTSTLAKKTWTAEVENLTRSIIIEGTPTGRSHIFIHSTKSQTIQYVEGRYLGPRKGGGRSRNLISGLYGLHLHLSGFGTMGSIVEGCAFHDIGNRVYVPHVSHGVAFKNNIAHRFLESAYWWDPTDRTHFTTYDGNIASMMLWNGINNGTIAYEMGLGDGNVARRNVAVYTHMGDDPHQGGGFAWNANNSGVWVFENNLSHSQKTALFVWDNSNLNHVIRNYDSYNNELAMHHGAYINSYNFIGGVHYNSRVSFEATSGNTTPMFENLILDGGGKQVNLVVALSSPVTAGEPNDFVNCTFGGQTGSIFLMKTEFFAEAVGRKIIDVINPTYLGKLTEFASTSLYDSYFRVQPKTGSSIQISKSGSGNISSFYPSIFGTGTGLVGKYFNGSNFNDYAFTRLDPLIKFQQWSVNGDVSPDAVDHRINPSGAFSIEWEGYYEPQFSGQQQVAFESYGGVRFWLDNRLILDRWAESAEGAKVDAPVVVLEAGKRYKIKLQHFDNGGNRGIQMYYKRNGSYWNIPMSQLYAEASTGEPEEPLPNRAPAVSAGPDITTTDTLFKIEGSASDPDNNLASVKWSGTGVTLTQNLSDAAHVMVKAKPGVYELTLTATDQGNLSATDKMVLIVQPKVDTSAPVNQCTIFDPVFYLKKYPDVAKNWRGTPLSHYEAYGRKEGRIINAACEGSFKNAARTDSTTCTDGSVIRAAVEAGKYTAATQALADALALQDINGQLAKCPVAWATFTLPDGKKLHIFGSAPPYKFLVQ